MAYKADVRTTFEPNRVIQPIYTGGAVALSQNGKILASSLGEEALLTDLDTGTQLGRIEGDGESLTTLALTPDANYVIACSRSLSMRIYILQQSDSVDSGIEPKLVRTLKPHTTPVVSIAVDSSSSLLATGGADGEIKIWDIRGGFVTHTFHGHSGVISALHFFQVDSEMEQLQVRGKKRKSRQPDVQLEPNATDETAGFRLASGGEDGKIRVWDLHKRKSIANLDSHVSVVRSLDYSRQRRLLLSASRDKTAMLWDAKTWKLRSTVAVLESVEATGFIMNGAYFYTGGETARLRLWRTETGSEITEDQKAGTEIEGILDVLHYPGLQFILTVHADQTLVLHSIATLSDLSTTDRIAALPIVKRISGTHDEVIDLAYIGKNRDLLALATNLEDIRIISLGVSDDQMQDTSGATPYFGADVALLKGHTDIIITLDTDWSGCWLATGAKDNTAKLWRLDTDNSSYVCYATFTGHTESVSAVAISNSSPVIGSKEYQRPLDHPPKFLLTGSSDKTIKRWDIGAAIGKTPRAVYTRKAHDKDINAIETSYMSTSSLFASASQDRTVKIWDIDQGEAIGVLRGHKRGVWTVAFSPSGMPALTTTGEGKGASTARGMVVTGSGDKTVKIWSLTDYSCLRTFEGHANSILKVVWLPPPPKKDRDRNVQVASAAGDGLVKIWDAQSSECATTLDNHIDRVWALAVKPPPLLSAEEQKQHGKAHTAEDDDEDDAEIHGPTLELVSGSADSTLTFWSDTTETTALQAATQATARIEQDQELQNHIRASNYREALILALQLNHPKRLLDLFTTVVNGPHDAGSHSGNTDVDAALGSLSNYQLWTLLRRLRDWNANGRSARVAQRVFYAIQRLYPKERLLQLQRRQTRRGVPSSAPEKEDEEELAAAMATLSTKEKLQSKEKVKDVMDALKAYTDRHYTRNDKTGEERFVLLWILQQMDGVSGADALTNGNSAHGLGDASGKEDVMMLNGM